MSYSYIDCLLWLLHEHEALKWTLKHLVHEAGESQLATLKQLLAVHVLTVTFTHANIILKFRRKMPYSGFLFKSILKGFQLSWLLHWCHIQLLFSNNCSEEIWIWLQVLWQTACSRTRIQFYLNLGFSALFIFTWEKRIEVSYVYLCYFIYFILLYFIILIIMVLSIFSLLTIFSLSLLTIFSLLTILAYQSSTTLCFHVLLISDWIWPWNELTFSSSA